MYIFLVTLILSNADQEVLDSRLRYMALYLHAVHFSVLNENCRVTESTHCECLIRYASVNLQVIRDVIRKYTLLHI